METTKNTLIRAASIMMAICACVAIIISAFNISLPQPRGKSER